MKSITASFWAETLKVRKSNVLWLSMAFFAFVAMMMGFIVFLQQHPELSDKLGLIGVKASMLKMGQPNWENYMVLLTQGMAGVGLVGFGFITSWVFGREYTDHTLKDLLALPIKRSAFVVSKLMVVAIWCLILAFVFLASGVVVGQLAGISGWSHPVFLHFLYKYTMVSLLTLLLCTPVAFFASYSKGILLPIGVVILTMMMANFTGLVGVGPYFPWSIPGMFCVPSGVPTGINAVSYLILSFNSAIGLIGTIAWWRFADQK